VCTLSRCARGVQNEHVAAALTDLADAASRESAIAAVAFPPALSPAPPGYGNFVADLGVAIVTESGRTSLMAATAYVHRVLDLRHRALKHLRRTMALPARERR